MFFLCHIFFLCFLWAGLGTGWAQGWGWVAVEGGTLRPSDTSSIPSWLAIYILSEQIWGPDLYDLVHDAGRELYIVVTCIIYYRTRLLGWMCAAQIAVCPACGTLPFPLEVGDAGKTAERPLCVGGVGSVQALATFFCEGRRILETTRAEGGGGGGGAPWGELFL